MPEFALIYRTGTRLLTPAEREQRRASVRAWALDHRARGVLGTAVLFGDAGAVLAPDGAQQPATVIAAPGTVAAVSVIHATDLAAAIAIAKTHPGLAFGTEVEVRETTQPAPAPQ